jgi:hypothetical protein
MIEGLIDVVTPNHEASNNRRPEGSIEDIALQGATAIQRLIADRDNLRTHNVGLQRDLAASSATNENLRRRLLVIRQHYLDLGTKILKQLEQFDQVTREAITLEDCNPTGRSEKNNLVEIARRFSPEPPTVQSESE